MIGLTRLRLISLIDRYDRLRRSSKDSQIRCINLPS
jgi:hypothetical protein